MTTDVHQLDDGAWLSVDDSREVNVGSLWRLARQDVCPCRVADFLTEGFVAVGVDGDAVQARIAGRCIQCGDEGVTDWLTLGRVDPRTGEFRHVDRERIQLPRRRTRPSSPA